MQAEIEESNLHSREFWKLYAQVSPHGQVFDQDGLSIADAKQPWFFMNLALLKRPIVSEADLERIAREALDHFQRGQNPWVFTASEDWFGPGSEALLSRLGLVRKLDLLGMVAERVRPPKRSLPDTQLRRIDDEKTRLALGDLNADAYGVPRDWGRQALGSAALWRRPLFGTIAYINDKPVSGAFALAIDKALYVGWVATAELYRRRGLAELVIRASLEDARRATGLERTILHASKEGCPVYSRMGYRPVAKFPFYGT